MDRVAHDCLNLMAKGTGIVLYVEDEDSDRLLMKMAFAHEGLGESLRTVNDGRLAVEYLSAVGQGNQPTPNVILLDLNLPEVHGFDVLKWIRAHPMNSQLPVVVFTSSERVEDRSRAKLLGANDLLQKPSSLKGFQEVARKLHERYLNGSSPTREGPTEATGPAPT